MTTIAVLDYGSGNLRSVERAIARTGANVIVTPHERIAMEADGLVVPGVGAYAACMQGLLAVHGDRIIDRRLAGGRPVLGICVGMQIMFTLGVVEQLDAPVLPHMGWNTVTAPADSKLFAGVEHERFYFVHSYGVKKWKFEKRSETQTAPAVTWAEYGSPFVAAIENGPLWATQFHPEKSGDAGAQLLRNWVSNVRES